MVNTRIVIVIRIIRAKNHMRTLLVLTIAFCLSIHCFSQTCEDYLNKGIEKDVLEDYVGAIAAYTKAIELNPKLERSYFNRGLAKDNLHDYLGAIADYSKALEINPKDSDAYYNRGAARLIVKQKEGGYFPFSRSKISY